MNLIEKNNVNSENCDIESLKEEFIVCLKKIKYKTNKVSDSELGAVKVISGGSIYVEISELSFMPPEDNTVMGWEIPKGVAERAIEIMVTFLNCGYELTKEMREYLSAGLQSSISENGMDLQDSFNLRSHNKTYEKEKLKARIGTYIFYRKQLNEAIKKVTNSGYTHTGHLNEMLYGEIKTLFGISISDHKTLARYEAKKTESSFFYNSLSHMIQQNPTKTLMYKHCLKLEIEKESNVTIKNFKSKILDLLEKSTLN